VKSLSDLDALTIAKIGKIVLSGKMPITFVAYIDAKNPNIQKAAVSRFAMNVLFNNSEVLQTTLEKYVEILPNTQVNIPLQMTADIGQLVKGDNLNNVLKLLFGNTDTHAVFSLKLKPSMKIGTAFIDYPGYITLTKDFKSK
jgi:hypothetical protein